MTHGRRENAAMPVRSTSSSCVHIGTIRSQVSGLTVAIMSRHSIVGCACPRERQHFHPSRTLHFFKFFTPSLIQRIIASFIPEMTLLPASFLFSEKTREKRKTSLWRIFINFINYCRCFLLQTFKIKLHVIK